ncbi:28S ribosomal protein S28, mitochondrial, partial [Eufriesea mexicana]
MNMIQRYQTIIRHLCSGSTPRKSALCVRNYSIKGDSTGNLTDKEKYEIGDIDSEFNIFKQISELTKDLKTKDNVETSKCNTFTSLLRHSKFINLGDPTQKAVVGEIFNVVGNDLYIDFGWKFHCVCPRPELQSNLFTRGTKVKLLIKDLELSTRFLGATTDLTLLEADCTLLSIIHYSKN